jgi:hypothetical protein
MIASNALLQAEAIKKPLRCCLRPIIAPLFSNCKENGIAASSSKQARLDQKNLALVGHQIKRSILRLRPLKDVKWIFIVGSKYCQFPTMRGPS